MFTKHNHKVSTIVPPHFSFDDTFFKVLQTGVSCFLGTIILQLSSTIPNGEHTNFTCNHWQLTLLIFLWLYWCGQWHTHLCLHSPWRPASYAQSERVSVTKLLIRLWLWLLLYIHAHWMGQLNYRHPSMEWCAYPGLVNAAGKISSNWSCWVWDIRHSSCSISWGLVPSQGVVPGKSKVYLILLVYQWWQSTQIHNQATQLRGTF